jgi:hypothetical protein
MQSQAATDRPNIIVDEYSCAAALGMSVGWLRADRLGKRILPFYKIGGAVRYNLRRVEEALAAVEVGGRRATRTSKQAA